MQEWWETLAASTRFFYGMAAFCSVFFVWQIIAAFMGMTGDDMDVTGDSGDMDVGDMDVGDVDAGDIDHHGVIESSQAFQMLSLRSVITFFTLFSWGTALYATEGIPLPKAMGVASIWGLGGMFAIALIFWGMAKLAETGTKDVASCQGQVATVYLDIPENGFGEIKTTIGEAIEHVRAKSKDGDALPAGTQVRVTTVINQTLVEVQKLT